MYCRYCGEQIEDDSIFCRYCGKKVNGYQSVNHQFLNLFKGKRQQVEDNIYFEEQTYQQQILIESFSLNDFIKTFTENLDYFLSPGFLLFPKKMTSQNCLYATKR